MVLSPKNSAEIRNEKIKSQRKIKILKNDPTKSWKK